MAGLGGGGGRRAHLNIQKMVETMKFRLLQTFKKALWFKLNMLGGGFGGAATPNLQDTHKKGILSYCFVLLRSARYRVCWCKQWGARGP